MTTAIQTEPAKFAETTVTLHTEEGMVEHRGLAHPLVPGLAVTMLHFGSFDVTHVGTGKRIVGGFERVASAYEVLAEFGHFARAAGVSFADAPETWTPAFHNPPAGPVTFTGHTTTDKGARRPTDWSTWLRVTMSLPTDEFPWEDESPSDRAWDHLRGLAPATTPVPEDADRAE